MQAQPKTLLVRADASQLIGTGHVMRCLSLIQVWIQRGGRATLITHKLPQNLIKRISGVGCQIETFDGVSGCDADSTATLTLAAELQADVLIVDGYAFKAEYIQSLKQGTTPVLSLQDFPQPSSADFILNQNMYAAAGDYPHAESQLLLGGRYALLRQEFLKEIQWQRDEIKRARRVLITCGGTDPALATIPVLKALAASNIPLLEVVAVVSSHHPQLDQLKTLCDDLPFMAQLAIDTTRMPQFMQWADMAITAAGTTCWELAFMGLPAMCFAVAENQVPVARVMQQQGLGIDLGWFRDLSQDDLCESITKFSSQIDRLNLMSQRGRNCIDGHGAERVVSLLDAPQIQLRPAIEDDSRMLWEWRNDPVVRNVSFTRAEIPFENHTHWFQNKLADKQSLILIAHNAQQQPFGQVRFDITGTTAEISISIAQDFRASGYGTSLIRQASEYLLGRQLATLVVAEIKPDNIASQKAFTKAGYVLSSKHPQDDKLTFVFGQLDLSTSDTTTDTFFNTNLRRSA